MRNLRTALILLLILCPKAGLAATIVVNTTYDTRDLGEPYQRVYWGNNYCRTATGELKQRINNEAVDHPHRPVSLRRAIIRANNNDEPDTIRFDPAVFVPTAATSTRTITLDDRVNWWPRICEDGTTIDGDVNGDGTPDVVIRSRPGRRAPAYSILFTQANNTTIRNLTLSNFSIAGVYIFSAATSTPVTGTTITNTTFDNTYTKSGVGIWLQAGSAQAPGTPGWPPTPLQNWRQAGSAPAPGAGGIRNTTITGNTFLFNNDNLDSGAVHLATFRSGSFIDGTTIGASLTDPPSALATKRNIIRGGSAGIQLRTNYDDLRFWQYRLVYTITGNPITENAITNTTIRGNHFLPGNDGVSPVKERALGARIRAWSPFGPRHRITDLHILDNRIESYRYNSGIYLAAGSCGASNSEMTATIARNTVSGNGGLIPSPPGPPHRHEGGTYPVPVDTRPAPAIVLYGGNHGSHAQSPCITTLPVRSTSNNRLSVTLEDNVVSDNWDTGIAIIGGSYLADANTVVATSSRNRIIGNGRDGIAIIGGRVLRDRWPRTSSLHTFPPGQPVVTGNAVAATLTDNEIRGHTAGAGLRLWAGGCGPANNNRVTVNGQRTLFGCQVNRYDIVGQGSMATSTAANLFPANIITNPRGVASSTDVSLFPANRGTGNQLSGSLAPQSLDPDRVVVGDGTSGNTGSLMITQPGAGEGGSPQQPEEDDSPQQPEEDDNPQQPEEVFLRDNPCPPPRPANPNPVVGQDTDEEEINPPAPDDPNPSPPQRIHRPRGGGTAYFQPDPADIPEEEEEELPLRGLIENPRPQSYQSGIGLVSGWVCEAERIEIEVNGTILLEPAYGTSRNDTQSVCDDSDNGFGLLLNWNLLGDGIHTARLLVNDEELHTTTFTVTTLGEEFVRDADAGVLLDDFPAPDGQVRLLWQEANQNFMLAPLVDQLTPADAPSGMRGILEVPATRSYQSGIGLVSGWVCEAERVEIQVNGTILLEPAYGTSRNDTLGICGDSDNGFGLLLNWNLLSDGIHTARLLVDGEELHTTTFTVTTLGEEFVRGVAGETFLANFPTHREQVRLLWQEANQNFMLAPLPPPPDQ